MSSLLTPLHHEAELRRLDALHELDVLDTAPDPDMTHVSFEFYPPKTDEQRAQLDRTVAQLKSHEPLFASVTFGAGGSTLSYTPETVRSLRQDHGLNGVPHLSCMGGTRAELRELLNLYRALGCNRIVALRGDLPSGMARAGDFRFAADLVAFIRRKAESIYHPVGTCRMGAEDDAHAVVDPQLRVLLESAPLRRRFADCWSPYSAPIRILCAKGPVATSQIRLPCAIWFRRSVALV